MDNKRLKVLLVEPQQHPRVVEIDHTLQDMYKLLHCDCITATYPWDDPVALVADDEGLFKNITWNRDIDKYTVIKGNFFICGLSEYDFTDLSDELIKKYMRMFWMPKIFIPTEEGLLIIPSDDGTECPL